MQQGLLASIFLFFTLLFQPVFAAEIDMSMKDRLLNDQQLKKKVEKLNQYLIDDDIAALNFSLNRLSMPKQEAVRFMLIQHMESNRSILSLSTSVWLKEQLTLHPKYTIKEKGDGYTVTKLAFNYSNIAARILSQMKKDQQILAFVLAAEEKRLILSEWLTGDPYQVRMRQSIILTELDSLTPEAVDHLVRQLTDDTLSVWLPTSEVMVCLAQTSENEKLYKILWRMRTDRFIINELDRLAQLAPDPFAVQQLMAATNTPLLKQSAFVSLTQLHPLPQEVQSFLLAKLDHIQDGEAVAIHLANYGHESWLRGLATKNNHVRRQHVKVALSQRR